MPEGQDEIARLQAELARLQALHQASESQSARLQQALTEAHGQQTATAEILRVIASSQAELEPVFQAVAERAYRLCHASAARIYLADGDVHRMVMSVAESDEAMGMLAGIPRRGIGALGPLTRQNMTGRTILDRHVLRIDDAHAADTIAEFPMSPAGPGFARSRVLVPLLRDGEAIGVLAVSRMEYTPFSDGETALLQTFADQAVIAIENARLFQELQESNRQASEALEQQTATAEILRVIASSQAELEPVFQAVAERACRLCHASAARLYLVDGDAHRMVMSVAESDEAIGLTAEFPRRGIGMTGPLSRESMTGRTIVDRCVLRVDDAHAAEVLAEFPISPTGPGYARSRLHVPLLRDGEAIGVISVARMEYAPFSDGEVALLESFADQAVIAIENARLFQELEQRTAQLTRSVDELHGLGEVGQAVSSSLDLQTVLTTIVANATRLAGADGGIVYEYDETAGVFELRADDQLSDDLAAALQTARMRLGDGVVGRAALRRGPLQVEDIEQSDLLTPAVFEQLRAAGLRSVLAVPLLREDRVLGGLVLTRRTPGAFPDEVVGLLQTLATQSALAIHNARLYQTLEAQGQALAEASQHKSQFLANMSHELRTPLNAVIGYSEMLHEELSDLGQEALVPDVEKITAAGRHLLGLINDILDLSKIEAGKMDLFLESVDVAALLRDVATTVEPLMARNGNRLELHIAPGVGSMYADATKLRQIFFNLLGNAAKFTERGTIALRVERGEDRDASDDGGDVQPQHSFLAPRSSFLEFTVADNGIGMSEEQLDRLFQAFTQAEASTTRRFGGTGLGLTLVRHFAEMMEGEVQVTSAVGAGSTFVVRLPSVVSSLEQRVRERHVAGTPTTSTSQHSGTFAPGPSGDAHEPFVLIVDDDPASRELLRRYLEADGVRVLEAAGGVEGIGLARQLQPALITLDVLMPGLDGWAVLGMLKDDPATADIPVILLTILDDRDLGYALGAADYLTKPVDRDRLLRAVCKHVGRPAQGIARRALVVEDDPATREMLGRLLQREGWAVDEAANGRIGLERVAAGPPDLILLDLMMPELDGFGFVEQLRAQPAWRTIPVLVITAKDLTAQERLRLNGWVEQVLQKGAYTRTELFSEVRALVRASVARATARSGASGPTTAGPTTPEPTTSGQRGSDDDGENPPG